MAEKSSPQVVQQIVAAARSRQLDRAAVLAEQAVADYPGDTVLAALAGAVEFHRGQFARAIPLLQRALEAHPQDQVIRGNLVESLLKQGNGTAALELCDSASVIADTSLRLAGMAAFLAQEGGDLVRAVELYSHLVKERPDDWSSLNNLGNALSAFGRNDEAITVLRKAATLAAQSQPIRVNLSNALIQGGLIEEAKALLQSAAEAEPDDAVPMLALFAMYRDLGREDESYAAIAAAAQRAPDNAEIHSDYGQEASKRNEYEIAEREFEAALALDPKLGPSYVGFGSLYERTNREHELDQLIARGRINEIDTQSIAFIEALLLKRGGDIESAFAALEAAGDVVVEGRKFHLRGTMLDRLGRYDEAFEAFTAMNSYWLSSPTQPKERAALYRQSMAEDAALLNPDLVRGWSDVPVRDGRASPVFLVGFPRSGTTLLDTMLMREQRVAVLEEEHCLAELETKMGGVSSLAGLSDTAIQEGRDFYFDQVANLVDLKAETVIVDKHPLHLGKVAVARRFFPDARFILALRHPCDVILSCYLTNFRINNAMSNFLDLDDAVAMYEVAFGAWEKARATFDLPVRTVVYERLVEDTARELRPLFDWLGFDWPGDHVDHRHAARARGLVTTASYSQVTEPIYQRARGRWHNYEQYLTPLFDRLQPWADKYGYSLQNERIPPWPVKQAGVE